MSAFLIIPGTRMSMPEQTERNQFRAERGYRDESEEFFQY